MVSPIDLTDLQTVKSYFAPALTTNSSDDVLSDLITGVSEWVNKFCSRKFLATTYVENRHGNGRNSMRTKNWPIVEVSSVVVDSQQVTPTTGNLGAGWINDDKFIYLRAGVCVGGGGGLWAPGYFVRGIKNVTVTYAAGYITPGQIAISELPGWVTKKAYVAGNQILPGNGYYYTVQIGGVSGSIAPSYPTTIGQTVVDGTVTWFCAGAYTAPPAATEYLPMDLQSAVNEQVEFLFLKRTRMGITSTGGGAQRSSFLMREADAVTKDKLMPYKAVVPIGDYT